MSIKKCSVLEKKKLSCGVVTSAYRKSALPRCRSNTYIWKHIVEVIKRRNKEKKEKK